MGQFDLPQLGQRLVRPLQWLLVAAIGWVLLDTFWFFLGGAETTPGGAAPMVQTPGPLAGREADRPNLQQITSLNLFGRADADTAEQLIDAPETRLGLELQGVFLAATEARSSAIVAERNGRGELYFVGDRLPGNAELVRVLADRIVLRRGGSMETLRFAEPGVASGFVSHGGDGSRAAPSSGSAPQPLAETLAEPTTASTDAAPAAGTDSTRQPTSSPERTSGDRPRDVREAVSSYRDRLRSDPDGVMRELGVETVSVGERSGLRVDTVASADELARVGLRRGDVVLSVNGQEVNTLQSNPDQLDQIVDSGSARLEIQRGDRRFFVTTRIPGQ